MKSNKTTLAGLTAAVGILVVGFSAIFDGDPTTKADPNTIVQAIGVVLAALGVSLGGLVARDDDITSEGTKAPKALTVILFCMLLPLAGCGPRIAESYVRADEKTYLYAKPILLRGAKDKEVASKVLASWRARIDEEKKSWK